MIRFREIQDLSFANIFRIYISGSSASGKTHFAHRLLKSKLIKYNKIVYFHPDFHESAPVDWHETLTDNICYHAGLPDLKYIMDVPSGSCLIFDDLFSQCCDSKVIDYLFRVLSSKRKLSLIIMTQRYFADSKLGLSIRNCCNYHVLMNNADARTNIRVANYMQLKPEITFAVNQNKNNPYPYIFIDKTASARVTGIQVYIDVFGRYKQVIIGSMKYYLLTEADFKATFSIESENFAKKNENSKIREVESTREAKNHEGNCRTLNTHSRYLQRKRVERQVKQTLNRYKIRSKL